MKWLIAALSIFILGTQLGMYHERTRYNMPQSVEDGYKTDLNNARFDLEIEKQKLNILLCESGCKHTGVWGDGGKSYGIAQFQYKTFCDLKGEAGIPSLRWTNREDQIRLLDWALRHGYGKYWTCYTGGKL